MSSPPSLPLLSPLPTFISPTFRHPLPPFILPLPSPSSLPLFTTLPHPLYLSPPLFPSILSPSSLPHSTSLSLLNSQSLCILPARRLPDTALI